jgi:mono/diheme cytochrome c family protein
MILSLSDRPDQDLFMAMRITAVSFVRLLSLLGPAAALHGMEPTLPEKIEFNRHVRPILSENCFACHGPDKNTRKAGRRLDTRDGALAYPVPPQQVNS